MGNQVTFIPGDWKKRNDIASCEGLSQRKQGKGRKILQWRKREKHVDMGSIDKSVLPGTAYHCAQNGLKMDWPNSKENGFKITEFLNLISNFCFENAIK